MMILEVDIKETDMCFSDHQFKIVNRNSSFEILLLFYKLHFE